MRRLLPCLLALCAVAAACSSTSGGSGSPATTAGRGASGTANASGASTDGAALTAGGATGVTVPDTFSAMVLTPISAGTFPFTGTDGKAHVAYDLQLTNASPLPATLDKVEVVRGDDPTKVVATFTAADLVNGTDPSASDLRQLAAPPAESTTIPPQESRALFVQFTADSAASLPKVVLHHVYGTAQPSPPAKQVAPVDYLAAPFDIAAGKPRVIASPLRGTNWVALNGCCEPGFPHRTSLNTLNGKLNNSQRFAIDWKRTNDKGEFYTGDKTKNESYVDYGADVYAVADGTVVGLLDDVDANAPGVLPAQDPELAKKLTVQNVDGNHVVLDLGGGVYAMYAHFIKGSLTVKIGDKVKKGDKIAKLGNTGNANASHLHFQLMTTPSLLGADSLPYELESFTYRGQVDPKLLVNADDYLSGSFFPPSLPAGQPRTDQLPLNLAIVDFPG